MADRSPLRRWLARLSFSFFIIAFVLAYEAHKAGNSSRGAALGVATALALGLGLAGVRERHRQG